MNGACIKNWAWLPAVMLVLFLAAVTFRPLLPIDETRYLSVAWEMYQRHGWWQPLTMNYEPYHHKPPLLFWLINLSWGMFGVSRWAALVPVVTMAGAVVFLTATLGRRLFPGLLADGARTGLFLAGAVPFLIYSTLMMFDLTVTVFVLLALLNVRAFAAGRRWRHAVFAGIFMGLGVLAKGPVACLYVLPPFMFGPLWVEDFKGRGRWYAGMALAFLAALVPVMAWLVPVLRDADNNFAFWLVWEQTAGRISGNFNDAHARPFYFYLPLLPVMAMPWIFFPSLWRGRRLFGELVRHESGMRFLLCWLIPVFVCFCLISGKQPHYLVPLLPGVAIMLAVLMTDTGRKTPGRTLAALCVLVVAGQAVAGRTALVAYDLRPVASYVQAHPEHEYAFVRNYHAEIGFLARMEKPVADLTLEQVPEWLAAHPDGLAIIRYRHDSEVAHYTRIMDMPYRGKRLGIFAAGAEYP